MYMMKIEEMFLFFINSYYYTPGIYADEYIVFAFPFVCSSVRVFVRNPGTFVEFMSKFFC